MSLLVDVQLVPNKILEVVKARIMANRARLLAEQETAQVRGATRPRVQRPRFGATATTYRRPEPAAVGGMDGLVVFNVALDYLDTEDGGELAVLKVTTSGGEELTVDVPQIAEFEVVPFFDQTVEQSDDPADYGNAATWEYQATRTQRGTEYTQYYDFQVLHAPMGNGKAFAFVSYSFSRVAADYERVQVRNSKTTFEYIVDRWYQTEWRITNSYTDATTSRGRESFDFSTAFVISDNSIEEVPVTESMLSAFLPFIQDYGYRLHDATVSTITTPLTGDLAQDANIPGGRNSLEVYTYINQIVNGNVETTQSRTFEGAATFVYGAGTMEEKEVYQYDSPANRPLSQLGFATAYDAVGVGKFFGPGIFARIATPPLEVIPPGQSAEDVSVADDIKPVYFPEGPFPRRSFVATDQVAPETQIRRFGSVSGAVFGQLPEGAPVASTQVRATAYANCLAWDWDYPGYCRQQLAALGIYGNTTPDPE